MKPFTRIRGSGRVGPQCLEVLSESNARMQRRSFWRTMFKLWKSGKIKPRMFRRIARKR